MRTWGLFLSLELYLKYPLTRPYSLGKGCRQDPAKGVGCLLTERVRKISLAHRDEKQEVYMNEYTVVFKNGDEMTLGAVTITIENGILTFLNRGVIFALAPGEWLSVVLETEA